LSTTTNPVSPHISSAAKAPEGDRIPTLDGWRGIAILLVLIKHGAMAIRAYIVDTGAHGVAIFFVLSGFLITTRMLREQEVSGSINLRHFYVRRIFRLMPCAWMYLLFASLLGAASNVPNDLVTGLPASIFFYRNFIPMHSGIVALTGHFWSLSIEEQFYLTWPALFILAGAKRALQVALAITPAVALLRWHDWNSTSILKYATQYHVDALLVGCATAILLPRLRVILKGWSIPFLLIALLCCISRYSILIPLHETLVIAALLVATSANATVISKILDWKPIAFLGTISYSLYIWQQPFYYMKFMTAGSRFSAAAILLLIAVSSHYFLERPFIRLGAKLMAL
jgi:peptidoglycan/LPS O-acetylase OafA/YrhL